MEVEGFSSLERMGTGGLGDVYRARRLSTGSLVAIKVLRDWSDSSVSLHRAKRELKALVGLQGHPNVVHVEDFIQAEGVPVLVMEYAPGGSVYDVLKREGRLTLPQAVLVGHQTAAALAATHRLGIIHLDIKPQNLLIGPFGQVKVCDFGISALTQDEQFKTRTNAASYRYASPEQLNDQPDVGPSADVYSLGATLAHLANGKPMPVVSGQTASPREPFSYSGDIEVGEISPAAIRLFETTVNECLDLDPARRPTAAALVDRFGEIETILGSGRARALPVDDSPPTVTNPGEIVPRVVGPSGPVAVDPDDATVARRGAAPIGAMYQTEPSPPSVNYAAAPPGGYGFAPGGTGPTGTGQWIVAQPPQRRSGLVTFTIVLALLAAFVSLGAVGYVLTRQSNESSLQSAGDRSSPNVAVDQDGTATTVDDGATTDPPPAVTTAASPSAPTTAAPTTQPPVTTTTVVTPGVVPGDLDVGVPMRKPACDSQFIVIVASAITPGAYRSEVSGRLDQFRGSAYLRTDQTCSSLRPDYDGNPIYVVYYGPFPTFGEACDVQRQVGGDSYLKILDNVSDPNTPLAC